MGPLSIDQQRIIAGLRSTLWLGETLSPTPRWGLLEEAVLTPMGNDDTATGYDTFRPTSSRIPASVAARMVEVADRRQARGANVGVLALMVGSEWARVGQLMAVHPDVALAEHPSPAVSRALASSSSALAVLAWRHHPRFVDLLQGHPASAERVVRATRAPRAYSDSAHVGVCALLVCDPRLDLGSLGESLWSVVDDAGLRRAGTLLLDPSVKAGELAQRMTAGSVDPVATLTNSVYLRDWLCSRVLDCADQRAAGVLAAAGLADAAVQMLAARGPHVWQQARTATTDEVLDAPVHQAQVGAGPEAVRLLAAVDEVASDAGTWSAALGLLARLSGTVGQALDVLHGTFR